jgi:hypothetical protein
MASVAIIQHSTIDKRMQVKNKFPNHSTIDEIVVSTHQQKQSPQHIYSFKIQLDQLIPNYTAKCLSSCKPTQIFCAATLLEMQTSNQ